MPIYQYECQEHGSFEKIRKISERQEAPCPECEKICLQQVTAPAMVQGGFCDLSMKFSKKV